LTLTVAVGADQTPEPKHQTQTTDTRQSKGLTVEDKKRKGRNQEPKSDAKRSKGLNNETSISPRDAKKQQAISLLEGVLATTDRITPVEYRVLTEVEAATLLWQLDKERSLSVLKNAVERMREVMEKEKESKPTGHTSDAKRKRINFIILRKIAALRPDLISSLSLEGSPGDKPKEAIKEEWTDEARAIMSVAHDQIDKNPKLAARLAEQSLSFGFVDWLSFLERLRRRDLKEAEQLAILLMGRLRDSTSSPVDLQNLQNFVFAPEGSPELQDYFFQSLVIRLRQDLRNDMPASEMESDLIVTQETVQLAATYFPRWQPQLTNTLSLFEAWFSERSLPVPGSTRRRMMDVSMAVPASPGETQSIAEAVSRVGTIKDLQAREKEYQKLAASAALSADLSMAEEILAKINDEAIRQETTLLIYGPVVRKALQDGDWQQAQKQALNIRDPLGRTLVLDRIAQSMSSSVKDKSLVKYVYSLAVAQLVREWSTEEVAKAFLVVAKSLYPLDSEASLDATKSAVSVLNKITIKDWSAGSSVISPGLDTWVRFTNHSLGPEELLDMTEMIGAEFENIARHDADKALLIADGVAHRAFYSLARLAIARALLEQINSSPARTQPKKAKIS
jgi:hypothetical protein